MTNSTSIEQKISRLRDGNPPRVLDLFAGCGGLSLGFHSSGFKLVGAVEFDEPAAKSYGINFHNGDELHQKARDINNVSASELALELGLGPVSSGVDVIVGGPPCQAFARVGRPKLREVDDHPEAFIHDSRAQLYLKYIEYVRAFKPLALLMENVPDVLNHGGQNIAEEISEVLEPLGYVVGYTLLNSSFYGVPQMRERMFLIAYRKEVTSNISFPEPTNWLELPPGYKGSRQVALRTLKNSDAANRFVSTPQSSKKLPPAITAHDAIGDLPAITLHLEGKLKRGARRFTDLIRYDRRRRISQFAATMRDWPGFENREGIYDHVIRYLPRDWKLFARMNEGDQYPQAHELAKSMFNSELEKRSRIKPIKEGTDEFEELRAQFVPPYDPGKFPNKWRKMWRDKPARTLMAHLGKDSYSHIHYDSQQSRTISVREAARLMSFPDGFRFSGTMNPAFRQIGNAVPPLLAKAVATEIMNTLRDTDEEFETQNCDQEAVGV